MQTLHSWLRNISCTHALHSAQVPLISVIALGHSSSLTIPYHVYKQSRNWVRNVDIYCAKQTYKLVIIVNVYWADIFPSAVEGFLLNRGVECMPMLFKWYSAVVDICTVLQPLPSCKKGVGLRGTILKVPKLDNKCTFTDLKICATHVWTVDTVVKVQHSVRTTKQRCQSGAAI